MLRTSLMLCFHIASAFALLLSCTSCLVQSTACHYVGFIFVKQLHCC